MTARLSVVLVVFLTFMTAAAAQSQPHFQMQTQIDPVTQINWPKTTGSSAPTMYCPTAVNGEVTVGSATVLLASMAGVVPNQTVTGLGVSAGTTVLAVNASMNAILLSQPATVGGAATLLSFYSYGMPYTNTTSNVAYTCSASGWVQGGGGGGGFTAGGDLSGTSTSQKVIGIDNVPLCTGTTFVAGNSFQYTTASTPNPCWAATGGINLYVNGVLVATGVAGVSVNGS